MKREIIRILVYTYSSEEAMISDMARWNLAANGSFETKNKDLLIRSAVVPPKLIPQARAPFPPPTLQDPSMASPTISPFLNRRQAALYLGMSYEFVKARTVDGSLKAVRFGKAVRYQVLELDRFIQEGKGVSNEANS